MSNDQEKPVAQEQLPLLIVGNGQCEESGIPPHFRHMLEPGKNFLSYFDNHYAEQWILRYDGETREGIVYGGDCGWDEPKKFLVGLMQQTLSMVEARCSHTLMRQGLKARGK